jgi:hypothetical protein
MIKGETLTWLMDSVDNQDPRWPSLLANRVTDYLAAEQIIRLGLGREVLALYGFAQNIPGGELIIRQELNNG